MVSIYLLRIKTFICAEKNVVLLLILGCSTWLENLIKYKYQNLKPMKNVMNKLMAMLLMAVMVFATACTECEHEPYDDSQLKQQIAELYSKIASLEAKLNADMTTLQAMIAGQVTVVAHTQDADGNWTIKLSDGTKFVVYAPQQEVDLPTTLVYVMELNGEKVWATMDANGQLTPMLDNEGNVIPVIPVMEPAADPELETKVENGVIYIRIKGTDTWLKTGIASDATPSLETKVENGYIYIRIAGTSTWIKTGISAAPEAATPELETKIEEGVIYVRIKGTTEWIQTGIVADHAPELETKIENGFIYIRLVGADTWIKAGATTAEGASMPELETKVEDGVIYIRIKGTDTWIETGVSADSLDELIPDGGTTSCANITEVVINTVEGQYGDAMPVSVTFTLSDGSTFTVALESAYGFAFQYWGETVESFYLAAGAQTSDLNLWQNQLVDFVKEVPQGWSIQFAEPDRYGDIVVTLKAPTAEAIASGVAEAAGTVKLLGVFEGGKTAIAKLYVTCQPFAKVGVLAGRVKIEPNAGVEQFVYGITPAKEYSPAAVTEKLAPYLANGLWSGWEAPYHAVSSYQTIDRPVEEVFGGELKAGEDYVLWAALVSVTEDGWDYIYSVGSDYTTKEFVSMVVDMQVTSATFNAIRVQANFVGFTSYYGGFMAKYQFNAEESLRSINDAFEMGFPESLTSYTVTQSSYSGSILNLPPAQDYLLTPNTSYIFWVIPIETGKTKYVAEDLYVFEMATEPMQPGGSAVVKAAEPTITKTSIATELTAEKASMIYYKYYMATELPQEDALLQDLLNNAPIANDEDMEAAYNLFPGTEYVLAAVGVDGSGRYGAVAKFTYTTEAVAYNGMTVTFDRTNSVVKGKNLTLKWNVTGGTPTKYIYYINRTSHSTWANMGKNATHASAYIAMNPLMYTLGNTTATQATYTVSNSYLGQPHVAVVVAVDAQGVTSLADVWEFTPTAE